MDLWTQNFWEVMEEVTKAVKLQVDHPDLRDVCERLMRQCGEKAVRKWKYGDTNKTGHTIS